MNTFGIIIVLVVLAYIIIMSLLRGHPQHKPQSKPKHVNTRYEKDIEIFNNNIDWLEKEWNILEKEKLSGSNRKFIYWFFSDPSPHMIDELENRGIILKDDKPKMGHIDDILGLYLPVRDTDKETLKGFGKSYSGLNRTKGKYLAYQLLNGSEYSKEREERAATVMQREFYKFFTHKVPNGLSYNNARNEIKEIKKSLSEEQINSWSTYESTFDEITDPDTRNDYSIKKVSLSLYRKSIDSLRKQGISWDQIEDDLDIVIDEIIKLKPDIEK